MSFFCPLKGSYKRISPIGGLYWTSLMLSLFLLLMVLTACEKRVAVAPQTPDQKPTALSLAQSQSPKLTQASSTAMKKVTTSTSNKPIQREKTHSKKSFYLFRETAVNNILNHTQGKVKRNTVASRSTQSNRNDNIWQTIVDDFQFYAAYKQHPVVLHYVYKTLSNPREFHAIIENAQPYINFIYQQLKKRHMPAELVLLPLVESAYLPRAESHKGAAGLWQFTRSTGKHYGLKQNWWHDGRLDIYQSTIAALNFLQDLHYKYQDWPTALSAYNYGMGNIDRLIKANKRKNLPTDYWTLNLPKETREYVPKLIAYSYLLANAQKYRLRLNTRQPQDSLIAINMSKVTSIEVLAKAAGMHVKKFRRFNPGFLRWVPNPKSTYTVLLPQSYQQQFISQIDALIDKEPIVWGTHRVQSGDNLYNIARFYGIKLRALISANKFGNKRVIRPGDRLIIPDRQDAKEPLKVSYKKGHYVVKSGDTLYDLAKKYRVKIKHLLRANKMGKNTVIRPGQALIIPRQ